METIHYNEYGAPIEHNPKWCDSVSWALNKVGNLFYPKFRSIAVWLWTYAYGWGDLQCYTKFKGVNV